MYRIDILSCIEAWNLDSTLVKEVLDSNTADGGHVYFFETAGRLIEEWFEENKTIFRNGDVDHFTQFISFEKFKPSPLFTLITFELGKLFANVYAYHAVKNRYDYARNNAYEALVSELHRATKEIIPPVAFEDFFSYITPYLKNSSKLENLLASRNIILFTNFKAIRVKANGYVLNVISDWYAFRIYILLQAAFRKQSIPKKLLQSLLKMVDISAGEDYGKTPYYYNGNIFPYIYKRKNDFKMLRRRLLVDIRKLKKINSQKLGPGSAEILFLNSVENQLVRFI